MGIINSTFQDNGSPIQKLQKTLTVLNTVSAEASFKDDKTNKEVITRVYLEMILSEFSQMQQNPQVFNKWLQIDTKLDKALREYKSDVQMLIAGITQMGQAQQMVMEPTNMPGPDNTEPAAAPARQQSETPTRLPIK